MKQKGVTNLIYCCGCFKDALCDLVTGEEIYPHRPDLYKLPFWQCPDCNNYVGCHHKTANPTKPLGVIPTPELRRYRSKVHKTLDPLWQCGLVSRKRLYKLISDGLGYAYHTANTKSVKEVDEALEAIAKIKAELIGQEGLS